MGFIQGTGIESQGSTSSISKAFASNVTAGSLLVCSVYSNSNTPGATAVSDGTNTFAQDAVIANAAIYSWPNSGGGAITITFTMTNYTVMCISEFSGMATSSPLEAAATGSGTGTDWHTGNLVTSVSTILVGGAGMSSSGSAITPDANQIWEFEGDGNSVGLNGQYVEQVEAGTYTLGWTRAASSTWAGSAAAYKTAAAGGLSILPGGIVSGQVIGTHKLNRYIVTSGIASGQAMGTLKLNRYLNPSGIGTGQSFGTSKLNRYVTPTGVASGQAFGISKINRYVIPTGVSSGQVFGTNSISRNVKPSGLASGESFGTLKMNRYITPSGIVSTENIGSHIISAGIVYLLPNGIGSSEAFGNAQLKRFILPSGITSRESIGSHIVFSGAIYLLPSGIISSESFGQSQLKRFILATGISSGESIGTLSLSRWLLPSGIGSGEIFGGLSLGRFIVPSGIASSEIFGPHQFNFVIYPSGIISAESIGTLIISEIGSQSVLPTGIASAEAFGSLTIPIPFNRDWNELKARIIYLLRNDAILRGLLNKSASPYGVYFVRPPEKPSFPVLTMRFIDEIMDVEKNPQPRTIHVEFKAYSATNTDQILERVEELMNQSVNFTSMNEYKVSNAALDSIGPDDFDANFNIYTGSHSYIFFVDHHQLTTWS